MKVIHFDTETTGLDPVKNDIIQIAGIIEIDGVVKEEFDFRIQPVSYANISHEALAVHGVTVEQMLTYMKPAEGYQKIIQIFGKYVNKWDKADKFTPAGQNVSFDIDFLKQFFLKNNDKYYGSWMNWDVIDLRYLATALKYAGAIDPVNFKLETIARLFGYEFNAHNALDDIRMTRILIHRLLDICVIGPSKS